MNKKGALAVFAKTPELSPVKTRLAQTIGAKNSLEFYNKALICTASIASQVRKSVPDLHVYWAVAEPIELCAKYWSGFPLVYQGHGGLGDRLSLVYDNLLSQHDYVCFIGADSPHLSVLELRAALDQVRTQSDPGFVLGKTLDGGFYFFGGNTEIPKSTWTQVQYSTENTFTEISNSLMKIARVHTVAPSFDIDTKLDLRRYLDFSLSDSVYNQEQIELFKWVQSLI